MNNLKKRKLKVMRVLTKTSKNKKLVAKRKRREIRTRTNKMQVKHLFLDLDSKIILDYVSLMTGLKEHGNRVHLQLYQLSSSMNLNVSTLRIKSWSTTPKTTDTESLMPNLELKTPSLSMILTICVKPLNVTDSAVNTPKR